MSSFKILAFALLGTVATVTAQDNMPTAQGKPETKKSTSIGFGLKGGVNFSTVASSADTPDYRPYFHAGLFAEVPVSEKFSLQVEALYGGQGYRLNFDGPDNDRAEVQLDYINVPVLARVYVLKCLSIDVGPQFSFLVNDELDYNPFSDDGDVNLDAFNPNTFDLGIAAGLTVQTGFGLFVSGRYTYGLTKIYDTNNIGPISFDGVHNQVLQASLGYKF